MFKPDFSENVMLDLETLSIESNAAIVSIGATYFDLLDQKIMDKFYIIIDIEEYDQWHQFHIDPKTIKWWMKQPHEARKVFTSERQETLTNALHEFQKWLPTNCLIWGNGADFDNKILSTAYKIIGRPQPWSYKYNTCYRTIKNRYAGLPEYASRNDIAHNALQDAIHQTKHLFKIAQHTKFLDKEIYL